MHLTGKGLAEVRAAIEKTRGDIKLAVFVLEGVSLEEAKDLLARAGGRLREALALAPATRP